MNNQWMINVHDLMRSAGNQKLIQEQLPAPSDLGLELIAVPEGSTIDCDLKAESVVEGVLVTGTVAAELAGQCARCLEPLAYDEEFSLTELFYYPNRDVDEDSLLITDDQIDLEAPLRDAIVLELPFSPLCEPDCAGLCPQCGMNLNQHPDHHHEEPVDARWQALEGLFDNKQS